MIRMLLATTALTAVLATGAIAQDASSSMMDSSAMDSSSMMDSSVMSSAPMDSSAMDTSMSSEAPMDSAVSSEAPMDSSMMDTTSSMTDTSTMSSEPMDTMSSYQPRTPVDILQGYSRVDTDRLATKIIGSPVYTSAAADAEKLGEINDLVLNANGEIAAAVLGVGGFLGIGEKQVAVDYTSLQWVVAADNTERFVLETTKDDLTSAPDFTTVDDQPGDDTSMVDATSSAAM